MGPRPGRRAWCQDESLAAPALTEMALLCSTDDCPPPPAPFPHPTRSKPVLETLLRAPTQPRSQVGRGRWHRSSAPDIVLPPNCLGPLSPAHQDARKTQFTIQSLLLRTRMVSPVPYFSLKHRAGNNLHLPNSSTAWKCFSLSFCLFVCYTWGPQRGAKMSDLLHSNCLPLISTGLESASQWHMRMQPETQFMVWLAAGRCECC